MIHPFKARQAGPYDYGEKTDYNDRHLGIDWYTNFEDLRAPVKSRIVSITEGPEGGRTLVFQPIGEMRLIRWLHLNKFYVSAGQVVEEGQVICQSGNSGHRPGTNTPYQPHTHEDHWKSKVTLRFADTLNPHDFYKRADMNPNVKTINIDGTIYAALALTSPSDIPFINKFLNIALVQKPDGTIPTDIMATKK